MKINFLKEILEEVEINGVSSENGEFIQIDPVDKMLLGLQLSLSITLDKTLVRLEVTHPYKYTVGLGSFLKQYEIPGISVYDPAWSELEIDLTNSKSVYLIQTVAEKWVFESSIDLNVEEINENEYKMFLDLEI